MKKLGLILVTIISEQKTVQHSWRQQFGGSLKNFRRSKNLVPDFSAKIAGI